ncbi:MAG: transcription antitermination factor NusB [Clostridia bacterium]|nr:transcription antitermination factor NusB [Clostridia bacterium]
MLGKRKIRKNTFNLLFGYSFSTEKTALDYFNIAYDNFCCEDDEEESVKNNFLSVCENVSSIDEIIEKYLQDWKLNRLSKTTIAILRLSVYEMLYAKLPPAISINEAIELAKQYCEEGAPGYINGVLNKIAKSGLIDG